MVLVIGSTALKALFPDQRMPKDFDTFSPGPPIEVEENFWDSSFARFGWANDVRYATLHELYTIKVSHIYWDLPPSPHNWTKHAQDILFLKSKGAELNQEMHDTLYEVWEGKHGRKRVNLNMAAGEFFDDAVPRIYDHDSIHRSVAHFDEPLYTRFLKPGEEIAMDMHRIRSAPFMDQVLLFREEVATTALERIIIPSNYTASPRRAWVFALRRTVTSLTKGWSATFIADNLSHFWEPRDYIKRHYAKKDRLVKL